MSSGYGGEARGGRGGSGASRGTGGGGRGSGSPGYPLAPDRVPQRLGACSSDRLQLWIHPAK